ncbi:MAG TPA: hypothetical protein VHT74_03645 [Acetobacteraceae bacterium]|nr:hypothetical protein [Acetobacteraceae bacterium]
MTAASIALATRMWNEGVSARLIGQAVGCSKGAVVGFASRSGLAARTSPIVRRVVAPPVVRRLRQVAPASSPGPAPVVGPRPRACQFLIGDDRRTWRMCGAATDGGVWCVSHRKVVFTPAPQRRRVEEVAA